MNSNDLRTVFLAQGLFRTMASYSTLIILGLLAILAFLAFIWAAFLRNPSPRRPVRGHHSKSKDRTPISEIAAPAPARGSGRRRKRRRSRAPLNPTLAQTHGLPPVRDERSTPPPSY